MATSYFRERARNPYLRNTISLEDEQDISPVSPTFSRPMPLAPEEASKQSFFLHGKYSKTHN